MTVRTRPIDYDHDGHALGGELAWDDAWDTPRPAVLVVHDGIKSKAGFEKGRAEVLAGMGYAGFVVDVYGKGIYGRTDRNDSDTLMAPFREDRSFLQQRLLASVRAAVAQPEVDGDRLAAIGYCFGGMCVLDLARMNAPVLGVASFHGVLTGLDPAKCPPPDARIAPRVMALHGWDDPFVPAHTIGPFAKEMSARGADWQLIAYGNTAHSFTNPGLDMPEIGIVYDATADRRSWRALGNFLAELFPA